MIKLIALVKREEGIDVEEFHRYWREEHSEVIKGSPDSAPPIRRYVQDHTVPEMYENGNPEFDGLAELWFDDQQAFEEWAEHPYYQETVSADEASFINRDELGFIATQETMMDLNAVDDDMVKLFLPLVRDADISPSEFHRYWRSDHAELAMNTPSWDEYINHYVQNRAINEIAPEADVSYDGVVELWFDDPVDITEWTEQPDHQNIIVPDTEKFFDREQSPQIITTHEEVI